VRHGTTTDDLADFCIPGSPYFLPGDASAIELVSPAREPERPIS
jgi:hypothetical protein